MSVEAMSWVFRHSPYKLGARLVHLAMADVANGDHDNRFWLSQSRIADKANVSRSTVTRTVAEMVRDGYLEVVMESPGEPVVYRFLMPPDLRHGDAGDVVNDAGGVRHGDAGTCVNHESTLFTNSRGTQESAPAKKSKSSQMAPTAIADDFQVTAEMHAWLKRKGFDYLNIERETDRFVAHAQDHGRVSYHWTRAWENWIRKAAEFHPRPAPPSGEYERDPLAVRAR